MSTDTTPDGQTVAPIDPAAAERHRQVVAALTAAVAVVALVGVNRLDSSLGPMPLLAALVAAEAVNVAAAFLLKPRTGTDIWLVDEAVFVCALGLLPPLSVLIVFTLGVLIGLLVARERLVILTYGTAVMTVAASAGLGLSRLVSPLDASMSPRLVAALIVGVVGLAVANELVASVWALVVYRRSFWSELATNLRQRSRGSWSASVGLLAAFAGRISLWALLLALPPLIVLQLVIAAQAKARRDRERTHGLLTAATEAHASVHATDVHHAFTRAAARLLQCATAEVIDRPPGRGEWGVRLSVGSPNEQWLVVSDRHSHEPLDDDDRELLDTLGAVGSSALENARLVEEIKHQAVHDSLTDLPNQLLFNDRVQQAITQAVQQAQRFAVGVLDIDAFKKVNDSLGHTVGNDLLQLVADRLRAAVGPLDTVARLGGDHFTILMPGVSSAQAAGIAAERTLAAIREPVRLGGHELFMTASIGIAFHPEDGTTTEHLLRNADAAMHRAKEVGRGGYRIYAASMNALAHVRLAFESELHNALEHGELTLRYQPQVELRTERIVGIEALVRWNHPVLGLVGPGEFIPIAEESGFIVDVDMWVLEDACRQGRAWAKGGLPAVRISVNLSGRHFQTPERLVRSVCTVLARTGFDPAYLELEVTEGVAVSESDEVVQALEELRQMGVRIAIDDFGTGYSMLGRLRHFPVDRLKIDRSFVSEINSAKADAPLVVAIIAMARSLQLETIAEGVETRDQHNYLLRAGCDHGQGFLFAEPREADAITRLLEVPATEHGLMTQQRRD